MHRVREVFVVSNCQRWEYIIIAKKKKHFLSWKYVFLVEVNSQSKF
jgi:hypothetical protein